MSEYLETQNLVAIKKYIADWCSLQQQVVQQAVEKWLIFYRFGYSCEEPPSCMYMYIISSDSSAHMNHPHTLTLASVYTVAFFTYMNKHTHKLIVVTKYS